MDVTRKQRSLNFPKNDYFLPPDKHPCVCVSGDKKCLFFKRFGVLFLVTLVLRFSLFFITKYISAKLWLILKALIFLIQSESPTDELYWEPEFYRINLIYVNIVTKIADLNITSTNTFN